MVFLDAGIVSEAFQVGAPLMRFVDTVAPGVMVRLPDKEPVFEYRS